MSRPFPVNANRVRAASANIYNWVPRISQRVVQLCFCLTSVVVFLTASTQAAEPKKNEPGWYPRVITFGETRKWIESTPIELRPYRPFHFYGNTVRRMHYRGTAFPRFRNVIGLRERIVPRRSRIELAEQSQANPSASRRR